MSENLPKSVENQLIKQIAKESFAIALRLGIATIVILPFLFFGIGKHDDLAMILGDVFAIAVISLLVFGFSFLIISNIKAAKRGVKIEPYDKKGYEPPTYVPSVYTHPINPATGLPMVGGVDAAGNLYGCKTH